MEEWSTSCANQRKKIGRVNQCDGCRRGAPLKNGTHDLTGFEGSYPGEKMSCTAKLYIEAGAKRSLNYDPNSDKPLFTDAYDV